MPHFLSIQAELREFYGDSDEQDVLIAVSGDAFSGSIELWLDHRELAAISQRLEGFPRNPKDCVEFSIGEGSSAHFSLRCLDSSGHLILRVALTAAFWPRDHSELMTVQIRCAPSDIDGFCRALSGFTPGTLCEARINGRPIGQ